jgi:hypothetical protein
LRQRGDEHLRKIFYTLKLRIFIKDFRLPSPPVANLLHVMCNPMATVQTSTDRHKMNESKIFGKPCLLSLAKAKEKQRHPKANASCFTLPFAPTHLLPSVIVHT